MSESKKAEVNGTNGFAMPPFGLAKFALPGVLGQFSEQGVAHAREGCAKIKAASEDMAGALCETYSGNARSVTDYGLKVIEISNLNTASAIDFFVQLLGSKSAADVVTLSAEQARKTFDTASAQSKDLWDLTQKLATATGEPLKKHVAKVLHQGN
ncbi:phasin family protein [Bradyrhizobium lupini]|uniref:phasin family protein n=1 Tax=Rhizobium lupini TaxID=136996 RepID=UPI00366D979C